MRRLIVGCTAVPTERCTVYAREDYTWWAGELGREMTPGLFGDNLTNEGIGLGECVIGQRWSVGSVVLEVAQPRTPCFKPGMRVGDAQFVDRFDRSGPQRRVPADRRGG